MEQYETADVKEALKEWVSTPEMRHEKLLYLQDREIEAEIRKEKLEAFILTCETQDEQELIRLALSDAIIEWTKARKALKHCIERTYSMSDSKSDNLSDSKCIHKLSDRECNGSITDGLSDRTIEQARRCPIEQLVEVNKQGLALCVNHNERHASMDCRNGRCYCYSCGWKGDVIDLYMKINGTTFQAAVYALQ